MHRDSLLTLLPLMMAAIIAILALQLSFRPDVVASADSGRFDYVYVISPMFLYQGNQGVLLLDKRYGDVWLFARGNDMNISFREPLFVTRLPLGKLDQPPR